MTAGAPGGEDPYAVVVGLDCITGLQTARILAARGVPVIGVARDTGHPCCRTKACRRVMTGDHADEHRLVAALEELGPTLPQKAVLYPCTDLSVRTIGRHRDLLSAWYHVALADQDLLESLMDKARFAELAEERALLVPRTAVVADRFDAERASERLRFPCVAKPTIKDSTWERAAGGKVARFADANAWLAFFRDDLRWSGDLIVQEWIPGDDAELYSCNAYFDDDGRPLVTFVARKLRQWPTESGTSSLGEEVRNDAVLETAVQLFQGLGYRGLAYVEMKHDRRTGRLVIIEPNVGRPTGRSAIAEAGGVELLYTMYCHALGRPLPGAREQRYTGVRWIYLRHDAQSAFAYWRRGELTLRSWWRSWRGRKAYAVWSLRDPRPFFADVRRAAVQGLRGNRRTRHPALADSMAPPRCDQTRPESGGS